MEPIKYKCQNCLEAVVSRRFNVSHVVRFCDVCDDSFRFISNLVLTARSELEENPPDDVDWERITEADRFMLAEKMARHGKTRDDFSMTE